MQKRRNAFVDEEGHNGVDAGFDEIEGQDDGQQDAADGLHRHTGKDGGDDEVGGHHDEPPRHDAAKQCDQCALFGLMLLIEEARDQHEGAGGDDVHDDAIDAAGGADGKPLHHRNDDGGHQAVPGTESKGGDHDGDIGGVVFQKLGGGEDGEVDKEYEHDGEGGQQAELGQTAEFEIGVCHGGYAPFIDLQMFHRKTKAPGTAKSRSGAPNTQKSAVSSIRTVTVGEGIAPSRQRRGAVRGLGSRWAPSPPVGNCTPPRNILTPLYSLLGGCQ